jgi:hypothetical protein
MAAEHEVPGAPPLRAIREMWLTEVLGRLEDDPSVAAAGFVGSLGRGTEDDWSDVDLMIVVPDDRVSAFVDAERLPGSAWLAAQLDARHNAPRGAGAIAAQYVVDGLPLLVDWYVYPLSRAFWPADARTVFDRADLPRITDSFDQHLAGREVQPPTPKPPGAHRLLQVMLVPVAAKRIARRSRDTARMVEFVGGPYDEDASPAERLEHLRIVLTERSGEAPQRSVDAASAYLDLVAERVGEE